jgi:hypothetical protein
MPPSTPLPSQLCGRFHGMVEIGSALTALGSFGPVEEQAVNPLANITPHTAAGNNCFNIFMTGFNLPQ